LRNVLSDREFSRLVRNANIGLAVGTTVVVVGFYPARHSEVAITVLGLAMFVISMGVFMGLSARDERARRKRDSRSS
jgi:type III secretory pathway component EscT